MDNSFKKRERARIRRTFHVRKRVKGTEEKPRMTVYRSNRHLYVQLINDEKGVTLAALTTNAKNFSPKKGKEAAKVLGENIAKMAKEKNIERIVFDRGRFKYHGLLSELANAARKAGLQF